MPNRSTSGLLPLGTVAAVFPAADLTSACLALAFAAACSFSDSFFAFSSSSCRCFSIASCLIRSASSFARFSASAKSMGAAAFFAPKPPSFDFLAGAEAVVEDVVVVELEDVRREAPSFVGLPAAGEVFERKEDEEMVRGAEGAVGTRPTTGGVAAGVMAREPGLEVGLSQDVKKSSSSAGAEGGGEVEDSMPSTNMPCGYLRTKLSKLFTLLGRKRTYRDASSATRLASSSLYVSAIRLEYFFLVSESPSKAEPPFFVKNSLALVFPPTFIVRSWPSCHVSRLVDLPQHRST